MSDLVIRSYTPEDFSAIQRIHEQNRLDFKFPNLNAGDFLVHKVLELDGQARTSYALRVTAETYCWLDRSNWTDAAGKWATIKALDKEATESASSLGITNMMCCVPPGYERFGRRIKDIGYEPLRSGWRVFTKETQ
jgi:hypothetical protein